MKVIFVWGIIIIVIVIEVILFLIVAQPGLWIGNAPIAAQMRLVVGLTVRYLLCVTAWFASTRFDHCSVVPSIWLSRYFTLYVLVVLILPVLHLSVLLNLWLDHSAHWPIIWLRIWSRIIIALFEIIWESCTLGSLLMLLLQSCVVLITLTRDSWQLLLRLRYACSSRQSRLSVLILACCWSATCNQSDFFILILTMLYVKFRFACLYLVAFLTNTFVWDVIFFVLFFRITNLQMPIDKCRSKLVFSYSRCQ